MVILCIYINELDYFIETVTLIYKHVIIFLNIFFLYKKTQNNINIPSSIYTTTMQMFYTEDIC